MSSYLILISLKRRLGNHSSNFVLNFMVLTRYFIGLLHQIGKNMAKIRRQSLIQETFLSYKLGSKAATTINFSYGWENGRKIDRTFKVICFVAWAGIEPAT